MEENQLNAVVLKRVEVAPGLIVLRVRPTGWELPDFEPGQYAVLALPGSARRAELSDPEEEAPPPDKLIKRAYSIASSSKEKDFVELYITLIRSGSLTPRIFALKEGDGISLGEKFKGMFTLQQVPETSNIVMIATGTGIAPYMSMLRTEFKLRPGRRFAVFHGARHSWDLGYRAELSTIAYYSESFAYLPSVSRPDAETDGWAGHTGYVQDLWRKKPLESRWGVQPTPDNTHIFLCGAPAMVETMSQILLSEGFKEHKKKEPGQVHIERFW
jgi:ferredoxin--NADP+ reductase